MLEWKSIFRFTSVSVTILTFIDRSNVFEGVLTEKHFISGHYQIKEIFCITCNQQIGWRYLNADTKENAFKIGHYVVEVISI